MRLGVRKSLKGIASRRARRKRQNTEDRIQETGDRRGFEGWKDRCVAKNQRSEGFEESRIRRSEGFEESRIQGVKWRKTED